MIKFYETDIDYKKNDSFVITIPPDIKKKKVLMVSFDKNCNFPYFGFNWDALNDVLMDLEWIKEKNIILVHKDIPNLDKEQLRIYFEILLDVVERWQDYEQHNFEVYFPQKYYDDVKNLIEEFFIKVNVDEIVDEKEIRFVLKNYSTEKDFYSLCNIITDDFGFEILFKNENLERGYIFQNDELGYTLCNNEYSNYFVCKHFDNQKKLKELVEHICEVLNKNKCKVCGYFDNSPFYDKYDFPTYIICNRCGSESGLDDTDEETINEYKQEWINGGKKWFEQNLDPANSVD